jgi:hypothetical protein
MSVDVPINQPLLLLNLPNSKLVRYHLEEGYHFEQKFADYHFLSPKSVNLAQQHIKVHLISVIIPLPKMWNSNKP